MFSPAIPTDAFRFRRTFPAYMQVLRALENFERYAVRDTYAPVQRAWLSLAISILEQAGHLDTVRNLKHMLAQVPEVKELPPLRRPNRKHKLAKAS